MWHEPRSFHSWDDFPQSYVIYSCMPFDPQTVIDSLAVFNPSRVEWQLIDRSPVT